LHAFLKQYFHDLLKASQLLLNTSLMPSQCWSRTHRVLTTLVYAFAIVIGAAFSLTPELKLNLQQQADAIHLSLSVRSG